MLEMSLEYKTNPPDKYQSDLIELLNDVHFLLFPFTVFSKNYSSILKRRNDNVIKK